MSIPVNEITEEARLAILRGLASQVKFTPACAETFDFNPLLILAQRLGFRQEPVKPFVRSGKFKSVYEATPEADYKRYPFRE